jgi:hypothetical protein
MCQNYRPKVKKENSSIADELGIFEEFASYEEITPQKRAWITMKARKRGLKPIMVHAGIKARYSRIHNIIYGK